MAGVVQLHPFTDAGGEQEAQLRQVQLIRHSAFRFASRAAPTAGQLRITRLNIYSGLYLEWARVRMAIDPSKIIPDLVPQLEPDIVLVSHESMDHFDAEVCLRWLRNGRTVLLGSWGTIAALAGVLVVRHHHGDHDFAAAVCVAGHVWAVVSRAL